MEANVVLSMLSVDTGGIFPSQKYFSEKGSSFEEKLILLPLLQLFLLVLLPNNNFF